ncbi:MAG: hypothetical protein QME32_01895 [Endomicrobiia bacterium]|nr:hypothetical protein [Endomicrobiia bacterium]
MIAEVAFAAPPYGPFDYDISGLAGDNDVALPFRGRRVEVPFGHVRRRGYIIATKEKSSFESTSLKSAIAILDDKPVLGAEHFRLAYVLAGRYMIWPGVFYDLLYPLNLKVTSPLASVGGTCVPPPSCSTPRTSPDGAAPPKITAVCMRFGPRFERYRGIISETLVRGDSVVMIMPAVGDVRYATDYFKEFAPLEWKSDALPSVIAGFFQKISSGGGHLVIGTRRAAFLLPSKLSKIIIERDYDYGHKDGRRPYYVSRDIALAIAAISPDVEAVFGGFVFSSLIFEKILSGQASFSDGEPPEYAKTPFETLMPADFSRSGVVAARLQEYLDGAYAVGRSCVIHAGRKGSFSGYYCRGCSGIIKCPDCDVALSFVEGNDSPDFKCPYCSKSFGAVARCPKCGSSEVKALSSGAGGIASELKRLYPSAKVQVFSSSVTGPGPESTAADFIVTTSPVPPYLISKDIGAVLITDAGLDLAHPEFSAAERSFLRAAQYADFAPNARLLVFPAARLSGAGDIFERGFRDFYSDELEARKELGYPPYGGLAAITLSGKDEKKLFSAAAKIAADLQKIIESEPSAADSEALGPSPGPRSRLKGRFIYKVILKYPRPVASLSEYLRAIHVPSGILAALDTSVL